MGKPRKLIVSCRWTRRVTRLPRFFSMRCMSRTRAVSSIFCRSQGCSMENTRKIQKISPMPFMGCVLLSPRPVFVGVKAPVVLLGFLEQRQEDDAGHEAAHVGPEGDPL